MCDMTKWRVCVEREVGPVARGERLAFMKSKRWQTNQLSVSFFGGDSALHTRVEAAIAPWSDALGGSFGIHFDNSPKADVRIAFQRGGSWSYIGTECLQIATTEPTINLGWLEAATPADELQRVVLHEFGHTLGCLHEFQNPDGGIHWNEDAVYAYYAGPPNNWPRATTKANVIDKFDRTLTARTVFDPNSVMMYPIPPQLTVNGVSYDWKSELSDPDRTFIKEMYA